MATNYDQQINALYAGVGKTGNMIDQEGRDYWTKRLAAGENITDAFNASAKHVYAQNDTEAGKASPYADNNKHGYNVMTRTNNDAFNAVQALNAREAAAARSNGPAIGEQFGGTYQGQGNNGAYSYTTTAPAAPVSTAGLNNYTQNPYMSQMGADLQRQFNENLTRSTLPALRGGAMQAGGVGGSRQGIAEGLAAAGSNTGAASAVTNLFGQDYQSQMQRNLQQYQADQQFALGNRGLDINAASQANQYDLGRRGIDLGYTNSSNSYNLGMGNLALGNKTADNSYALGQGNLALGNKSADQSYNLGLGSQALTGQGQAMNFFTQQRGQDQTGAALGASLYNQGIQGEWSPIQGATGAMSPYTGQGTTTSNSNTGGGAMGAVGGALGAAQLWSNMNKGTNGTSTGWW